MSEQEIFVREFPVEFAEVGDGRTIDARIVPYNVPAKVADPPDFTPYDESFVPGAFERQTRAADRVKIWLNFEHEQGIRGIVGHGVELQDRADGLYGSFRVHDNTDGDKALSLVREGLLTGLSLEFASLRSRVVDGVTQRVRAHIDKVSLCRNPAFADSRVLALREAAAEEDEPEPTPEPKPEPQPPAYVDEVLSRVGYEPIVSRTVTLKPWDGAAERFTDEEYERSCLIDRGGDAPVKERCSLPVLEPDGEINANALSAIRLQRDARGASHAQKSVAARKLLRYHRLAKTEPPAQLRSIASK